MLQAEERATIMYRAERTRIGGCVQVEVKTPAAERKKHYRLRPSTSKFGRRRAERWRKMSAVRDKLM